MGLSEMYCIRLGCGLSKSIIWMLEALTHEIFGARSEGFVVARTHDGSQPSMDELLVTPKTCIEDWPQISKTRCKACGALRYRMPVFKAFSTFPGLFQVSWFPRYPYEQGGADFNMVEHGDDDHVQARVSPADNDAWYIGVHNVLWPEYPHQSIVLWHDIATTERSV